MTARVLNLAYQLRYHRVGGWALDRLGVALAWGVSAIIVVQWLVRGRPVLPAWHGLILTILLLGGAAMLALHGWAARRSYVAFDPQPGLAPPPPAPMSPEDKIPLCATGLFEVQARVRFFSGLAAYWRSYASREHAVLAIRHQTRFFVGRSLAEEAGMWYLFIRPEAVEGITPGQLRQGVRTGPALRVVYRWQPPAVEGKRPPKPITATAYLAFEDENAQARVWADVIADGR